MYELYRSRALMILNYPQSTPLHIASQNGNIAILDFLMQQGAQLLTPDTEGDTAEKVAANQETAEFLGGND